MYSRALKRSLAMRLKVFNFRTICLLLVIWAFVALFWSQALSLTFKLALFIFQISDESKGSNGMAALNTWRNKGHVSLLDVDFEKLTEEELRFTIHSYLDNTDGMCSRKLRLGHIGDGGWEVCDDVNYRPRDPCIVYSFGINYDFSFDDDAARLYGCHVYSFDPSMYLPDFNRSSLIHFYALGLDAQNNVNAKGWDLMTLTSIRQKLGHEKGLIDLLKLDIENYEWTAIPEMISTGELQKVRQLLVEFHVSDVGREAMVSRAKVLRALVATGFKKFYVEKNALCAFEFAGFPVMRTTCYAIYMLKDT